MTIKLPDLPYALDALEPHMSKRTIEFHHGKHHKAYVDKLNAALKSDKETNDDLPKLIREAAKSNDTAVFNNAGQVWNHTFFWHGMSPKTGTAPDSSLQKAIDKAFGGVDGLMKKFKSAATGQFGSGWAWLVSDADGKLDVVGTPNAEPAFLKHGVPLVTCDVWEHAYYLDYQNERGRYVDAFLEDLMDWDTVSQRYADREAYKRAA